MKKIVIIIAILNFIFGAPLFGEESQNQEKIDLSLNLGQFKGENESHFLFSGGGYFFPFTESENKALQKFGFGGELGRTVLATENLGGLRLQRQLWLTSMNARYNIVEFKNFRADFMGGVTFARDTEVLQVFQYGQWIRVENFGFKCPDCKRSWDTMKNYGIVLSYAIPLGKDYKGDATSQMAFPFRYIRYSNFSAVTGGVEFRF